MIETIPYETRLHDIQTNVVDIADFNERVVGAYNTGLAERGLPADDQTARSVIPGGTGALRDFSYIAPDIPEFNGPNCVGCMDCVTQCPDTAILGKVVEPAALEERLAGIADESAAPIHVRAMDRHQQILHRSRKERRGRRQVRHLH